MRNVVTGLALALVAVFAVAWEPSAFAFQQQGGAPAPAEAQPQAPVDTTTGATKPLGLSDETAAPGGEAGTEIRIPGLGKLGVLPKMDFGLELLYGAAEQKQPEGTPEAVPDPNDDLMIRGTVKHRF